MTAALPGVAPANDDELIRDMHLRLRKLETTNTLRVGPWVISTDPISGNLRATRPGHTVLIDETGATEESLGAAATPVEVDLTGYVTNAQLSAAIDGLPDIPTLPDVPGMIVSAFTDLYHKLTGILSNPVDALASLANFFRVELGGLISSARLPIIPLSHIRDVNPNLLTDGSFDDEASLAGFPDWDYDEEDGKSRPGAAYTVADGNTHIIHSNPIEVETGPDGDKLAIEVFTRWLSLTATAGSIQLAVSSYTADDQRIGTEPTVLASTSGAGTVAGWNTRLAVAEWTPPATAAYVVIELIVTAGATAGVVKFDDASVRKVGAFPQSFVSGLVGALTTAAQKLQDMINSVWTGITRSVLDAPKTLAEMFDALQAINPLNVLGLGGMPNIFETIAETWNQLWGGFARQIGVGGKSIADAANAASNIAETADQAAQIGEWNNAILGIRDANGFDSGMDPTVVSMYQIPFAGGAGADPPVVPATASAVPVVFWMAEQDDTRGSVTWFGRNNGSLTALYVDVYKVNKTTNQAVLLHTSFDLLPQASTSWKVMRYNMITANRVPVVHGDVLMFAIRVQGTGTHEIAGHYASWLPADTAMIPRRPAGTRSGAAGTISLGSISYVGDIPWVGVGIVEGDIAPPFYAPRTTEFATPGAGQVYNIPTWANYIDVIGISGAGGGHGGSGGTSLHGYSGLAGQWFTETLVRGVDFPVNATQIVLDIGAGGAGGGREANGQSGGATTRRAITGGKAALSAPGGAARNGYNTNDAQGYSPGNKTYRGITYAGGQGGVSSSAQNGQPGSAPGGSGAGGAGGFFTVAWAGGAGARGGAWVVARQNNS
ncbi:minor tail protein [Mycobacterium phage 39HC]|uniref:minor tail protein n=1 Tax=Mycobacterium phage 39HC TaxID=1463809 RepID=UPI0003F207F6|nr:minor tail protein [Mycobacterium phage 39HC]AHJ88326.1 hypothetical protein 39HC_026 [Mycobacterium phage 39HC]